MPEAKKSALAAYGSEAQCRMVYRMDLSTLSVFFGLMLLLPGLPFIIGIDSYIRREHRRILLIIAALSFSLIAESLWENALFINRSSLVLKYCLSAFAYSARPVSIKKVDESVQSETNKATVCSYKGWKLTASPVGRRIMTTFPKGSDDLMVNPFGNLAFPSADPFLPGEKLFLLS